MSKSSTASVQKISTQLPSKSAWSKGPPQSTSSAPSPRSQSPAPNANASTSGGHSRRPSALGQGVSFKDGVAGARSPVSAVKSGSSVTFGSIDDVGATISSSPAAVPTIKSENVKSFGTLVATPTSASAPPNGKIPTSAAPVSPATPSKSISKFDIKKMFQGSSGPAPPVASSSSSSDHASPSSRPSPLPQHSPQSSHAHVPPQPSPHPPPSQLGTHSYTPFVPGGNLRPQQNGGQPSPGAPRSPVYSRAMPNGAVNGINGRPNGAPGPVGVGGPGAMPAGMSSPRMGPPQSAGLPGPHAPGPVPMNGWPGYYYPNMQYSVPPEHYMAYPQQWMPQHAVPPHPPPGAPGGPPHGAMPMSPRNPPPPLHTPGTPTLSPSLPTNGHAPHTTPSPHTHSASLSSISSPPVTPSTSNAPGGGIGRLNTNASAFVPRQPKPVTIRTQTGMEVDLEAFKKSGITVPPVPSSPARKTIVRMETEEAKNKRLAEEQERDRLKQESEDKVKREAEEREKKQREAEERKKAEIRERTRKEAEEKEQARKAEEERVRKEEEEKARAKKEEEELKERLKREEEERLRREEEERAAAKEAEEKAKVVVEPEPKADPEEGEVDEKVDALPSVSIPAPVKEEPKEKLSDKASLRIDTGISNLDVPRRRPGPLDLSSTRTQTIPAPLPSALATARIIEDLGSVAYPEGIKSPKVELNLNAKQGKFRYDRDFLLQFMAICKEKPDSLPPLDAIGLEPSDQSYAMSRGGSGRRTSSASMPPPPSTAARQAVGLGISGFQKPTSNPFTMGQFATGDTKMTSAERFAMSNNRSSSVSGGAAGMPFGRPPPMVRSSSQGGPGGAPMGSNRKRSQRGTKRPTDDRQNTGSSGQGSSYASSSLAAQAALSMEPVAPLEVSANRWQPNSIAKKPQAPDSDSPEVVDRKVRGLLNKLTMERFDSISDQIISWANRSEREKDGRTLIQVIRLVFEKATDEAAWSEMYARLCRKMMEQISPKVQDDGIKNSEGKPIAGGQLFRKYLLNRCQEDFERGWAAKDATAVAAATKATEDKAAKDAAEKNEDESALYSEEYYAAQKAKRQGLGLIRFIGELFKLQMLTERIMHECVKKLLGNVENPEEEEIESLCKLLTTVGQILDTQKAHAHMDVYFSRMKELCKSPNVNSRMQFMLQDIIELRERKWIPRNAVAAPTTLAAVHEAAAKDRAAVEKETHNRMNNMSRGGSRRGGDRGDHSQVGPDGWSVAGSAAPKPPPPTKAGDLTHFGKIAKTTSMSFGPSSVFQGKKGEKSRDSTMTRSMSQNMFNALRENPELAADAGSKSSRPPSRKPSVDFGTAGVPGAPDPSGQRRKLNLLPRSKPVEEAKADSTPAQSETNSEDETPDVSGPSMSEAEAKTRVKEDSKELFSIRDLGEAELYFTKLPSEHRWRLVDHLVSSAIESKESDAQLVGDFFSRAVAKNQCSPASFEEGFTQVAEILDDIAIDAPKAFNLMAIMMKGARLDTDEERRTRLASKLADSDQLLSLLS